MPRISEERRGARRRQVLEAARACLQEHGLEALSMEMIVARSGLSTGAVYGYFKGKDQIINAAVTEGTAELADRLLPILQSAEPSPLPELVGQVLSALVDFGEQTPDVDRLAVSIHGWSHSQSDPQLEAAARATYGRLRELFAETAERWRATGMLDRGADPGDVGELLTSICLGFVAQRALAGAADVKAHVRALEALTER